MKIRFLVSNILIAFLFLCPAAGFPEDGSYYLWVDEGVFNFSKTKPSVAGGSKPGCADRKAALVELQQVKTLFLRDENGWWRKMPEEAAKEKIREVELAASENCS